MTTHAQEVCEQFEANAPARSHNIRQLEYTTDLLVQMAALQDEVKRLRERLAYSESLRASLKEQLRMLVDAERRDFDESGLGEGMPGNPNDYGDRR